MRLRLRPLLVATVLTAAGIGIGLVATRAGSGTRAEPPADFAQVVEEASRIDGLLSLLVQRDGQLVLERYFDGTRPDELLHLRSITKSVISLLVGIAIDRGDLQSVDQTLGEALGEKVGRFGPRKAALTLEHLLTMSAGLRWNEQTVEEFNRLVVARDPLAHYLERPFVATPGERWGYSSGASHVLSVVLSEVTGMKTSEYARRHLFSAIGIDRFRWPELADGFTNGAADLQLRPLDTVKLGELLLRDGTWSGQRVVSQPWIEASTRVRFDVGEEAHYGYHWWLLPPEPIPGLLALGHAGQTLVVFPEKNVIIQANCRWRSLKRSAAAQSEEVRRFLSERLLIFLFPELAQDRG